MENLEKKIIARNEAIQKKQDLLTLEIKNNIDYALYNDGLILI